MNLDGGRGKKGCGRKRKWPVRTAPVGELFFFSLRARAHCTSREPDGGRVPRPFFHWGHRSRSAQTRLRPVAAGGRQRQARAGKRGELKPGAGASSGFCGACCLRKRKKPTWPGTKEPEELNSGPHWIDRSGAAFVCVSDTRTVLGFKMHASSALLCGYGDAQGAVKDVRSRVYSVSTGDRNRRSVMNTTVLFLVGAFLPVFVTLGPCHAD